MRVAQLDARTDDFIRMLLDVSGRARPADLHGVSADDAASLLQAYAAAHPERPLAFTDGVLAVTAAPPAPEPEPAWEPPAPAESAYSEPAYAGPAYAPAPAEQPAVPAHEAWAATPPAAAPADQAPDSEIPAWVYEDQTATVPPSAPQTSELLDAYAPAPTAVPAPDAAAYAPAASPPPAESAWQPAAAPAAQTDPDQAAWRPGPVGVPHPGEPAVQPAPDQAAWQPTATAPAEWQPAPEQVPAADDWQGGVDPTAPDAGAPYLPSEEPVPWFWWLAPLFFQGLGGLVAWLVLRNTQPIQARKLLIFGLVMTAIQVLLGVLAVVFGLGAASTSAITGASMAIGPFAG